ncbi:MAG: chorismate mutase [Frankiales bacterium]|nr:chorismate mutase [Frankiales bacterium]
MTNDLSTLDPIATVADGRARLDDIDDRLLALLAERRDVSRQVQQLRIDAGGSRVEHSRENAIIRRWVDILGDGGAELALSVLSLCRGRR